MQELGKNGVQAALKDAVTEYGGIVDHLAPTGRRGIPDLLVTWPDGRMHLVETKRPKSEGGRLSPAQKRDHDRRAVMHVKVFVIWSAEEARDYALHNRHA